MRLMFKPTIRCGFSKLRLMHTSRFDLRATWGRPKCNSLPRETQKLTIPPFLSDTKFWQSGASSCTFRCTQNLLLHQKHVSRFAFFLTSHRTACKIGGGRDKRYSDTHLTLVALDEFHNPLGLPAGLGNLPLYAEKDGWYSVLGSWDGTTKNPEKSNEEILENNPGIPIGSLNALRNARPGPILIFCQYRRCSGNRLAIPLLLSLRRVHNTKKYSPLQQRPSFLRSWRIYLQGL